MTPDERRVQRDRLAGMRALDAAWLRRHVQGPPRMTTSRRIRRNALRELAQRMRWGRGGKRAKSFAETLRTIDVDRVVADPRVRDQEIALLVAATRGGV